MKVIGQLKAILGLDKTKFDHGLNDAERKTNQFSAGMKRLAGAMAAFFSVTAIFGFAKQVLQLYDVQAKAERALLVALKGREDIQKNIIRQAQDLQRITLFGDEESIAAASRLAMMLGTNETAIRRLLPLVQDLATAKFEGNLVTAAEMVAKSVGSSTNALSRYGITIEGAAGSAQRLEMAMKELNKQVGGQAKEAAEVGIGPFTQFKNIISDIKEELGKKMIEQSWVQNLFSWGRDFVKIYQQEDVGFMKAIWQAWTAPNETVAAIDAAAAAIGDITEGTEVYERTIADLRQELAQYKKDIDATKISEQSRRDELNKQILATEELIKKLTTLQRNIVEVEKVTGPKIGPLSEGTPALPGLQAYGGQRPDQIQIQAGQIRDLTEALMEQDLAVGILSNSFNSLFTATENGFKAMVDSIIMQLKRLVAELLARVAILSLLNVITGGGATFGQILKASVTSMGFGGLAGAGGGGGAGPLPVGNTGSSMPAVMPSATSLSQHQSAMFNRGFKVTVVGDIQGRAIGLLGRRMEDEY